jgi:hypothetical protein
MLHFLLLVKHRLQSFFYETLGSQYSINVYENLKQDGNGLK